MLKNMGRAAVIGLSAIGLGFLVIALAYNGSARVACVDCQMPYLLSGGALGLGLIGVGVGLLLFEALRRGMVRIEHKFDVLIEAMRTAEPAKQDPAVVLTAPAAKAAKPPTPVLNGAVVVGRSSFHRPDCRLVQGKEDVDYASVDDAVTRGLAPCRVCDPTVVSQN